MNAITGATGYVGGLLLERFVRSGVPVRALARDPSRLPRRDGVDTRRVDLVEGGGLRSALEGCDTAYYLVHSMEPGDNSNGDFGTRDRIAAHNFVRAAQEAGVARIVYLGGIVPAGGPVSPHLASRLEVERILLDGLPASVALRASILIGAQSSSFRILVRLVERLRVLPFPAWRDKRTQPIDERDAIEALVRAPSVAAAAGRALDIAGPDVLSYGEMIEHIAELMGVARVRLRLGMSQTPAASAVVAAITGQPLELVRPLMESLEHDLLPRENAASTVLGVRTHNFDRAVEHALRGWEAAEELSAR